VQLESATVIGLPADAWGRHKIGLIPKKLSVRLVIAEVLEDNPVIVHEYDMRRVPNIGSVSARCSQCLKKTVKNEKCPKIQKPFPNYILVHLKNEDEEPSMKPPNYHRDVFHNNS
jgi:hypothetical protein